MSKCTPAYSVFKGRNRDLELLFSPAKRPGKVMCVAMDYAKAAHAVLIANDEGMQLSPMLEVRNDRKGVEFLLAQARQAALMDRPYGGDQPDSYAGGSALSGLFEG